MQNPKIQNVHAHVIKRTLSTCTINFIGFETIAKVECRLKKYYIAQIQKCHSVICNGQCHCPMATRKECTICGTCCMEYSESLYIVTRAYHFH